MKNLIPSPNDGQTMSSLEIAELVESRHDKVKQSIERLASRGAIEFPPVGIIQTATKPIKFYQIGKRDSYVIVAQLSPEFTARLVDRWQELEQQAAGPQFNIPKSLPEALRLAADIQEKLEVTEEKLVVAENQIEQDKPKVEFAMAIKNTNGLSTIGEMAKCLGIGEIRLFKKLREGGFLMKSNEPYQRYVDSGFFKYLPNPPYTDAKGKTHQTYQTWVTGRGMIYFEKKFREERPIRNGLVIITGDIFLNGSSSEVAPC